jgi:hypothetical protein
MALRSDEPAKPANPCGPGRRRTITLIVGYVKGKSSSVFPHDRVAGSSPAAPIGTPYTVGLDRARAERGKGLAGICLLPIFGISIRRWGRRIAISSPAAPIRQSPLIIPLLIHVWLFTRNSSGFRGRMVILPLNSAHRGRQLPPNSCVPRCFSRIVLLWPLKRVTSVSSDFDDLWARRSQYRPTRHLVTSGGCSWERQSAGKRSETPGAIPGRKAPLRLERAPR